MRNRVHRRQLLKAASGLLSAPLLFQGRRSRAQSNGKAPLRFLTIMDTYGMPIDNRSALWIDSTVGDYALETGAIGSVLAPLSDHLDKLLVVSGVDHRPSSKTFSVFHHGSVYALTASKATGNEPNHKQQHASLDYALGEYLSDGYGLESARPYPHLYVSDSSQPDKISACSGSDGTPLRSIAGHENLHQTLFAGIASNEDERQRLALDTASQALALELAEERIRALRPQLVQANASQVLDAYETSVQELAAQLENNLEVSCSPPDSTESALAPTDGLRVPLTLDAIYHAFACDLTSSVLYTIGGEVENFMRHNFLAVPGEHSDTTIGYLGQSLHASTHGNTPDEQKVQELVRGWQTQLIADFVDRLSITPDVDGSMIIDNTVIFLQSALSNNTHLWGDYCHAIVAGKNTNLVGGFHYDLSGRTVNDLLATLGQSVTAPMTEFGGFGVDGTKDESVNNGPVEKMLREVYS